jgi:hypothetical protein
MGFSFASVKSTIHNAVQKPSLTHIAAAALTMTPVGLAANIAIGNKEAIKSTLSAAGAEIKKDIKIVESTVVKGGEVAIKGVKKAGSVVTSGFTNMLYIGGAALVGLVVLKMTVFK